MTYFKYRKTVVALILALALLRVTLVSEQDQSPVIALLGMLTAIGVVMMAVYYDILHRPAVKASIRHVNAKAYELRAETALLRQRVADLKAYQVLVPAPSTPAQHARLRQLTDALGHQRAIAQVRTRDTTVATADLRQVAGIETR